MGWAAFAIMGGMASVYFLLSIQVGGVLAGFGYVCGAIMAILAIMNVTSRRR